MFSTYKPLSKISLTIDDVTHHQRESLESDPIDRDDDETLVASDEFDFDDAEILGFDFASTKRGVHTSDAGLTNTTASKPGKRMHSLSDSVSPVSRKRSHVFQLPLDSTQPQHELQLPPPLSSTSIGSSQRPQTRQGIRLAGPGHGLADPVRGMEGIEAASRIREEMGVSDRIGVVGGGGGSNSSVATRRVTRGSAMRM